MTVQVSVVIPTFHRPQLLARCLEALSKQTFDAASFEIIVVDDGDCEQSREVVRHFRNALSDQPAVRYALARDTQGPAAARNLGWRHASGEVVAFTDDDTVPDPDWLTNGVKALAPDLAAVTGCVVVPTSRRPTDFALMTKGLEHAEFVTANAFVRRDMLIKLGGFDERFKSAWREDSDLQFRIADAGGSMRHADEAVVLHPVRQAPWGVSLKQQRNVFYDALLYKKHPHLYRLRIRPRPPWRYYVIVLCVPLCLVALAMGQVGAGVLMLGLAFALCMQFAGQRLRGTSLAPRHVAEMLVTSVCIPFLSVYWRLAGAWHFRVMFL